MTIVYIWYLLYCHDVRLANIDEDEYETVGDEVDEMSDHEHANNMFDEQFEVNEMEEQHIEHSVDDGEAYDEIRQVEVTDGVIVRDNINNKTKKTLGDKTKQNNNSLV